MTESQVSDRQQLIGQLRESARDSNVHVLENDSIDIAGVRFHGATLWTDFELFGDPRFAGLHAMQRMNDYRKIRRNPTYSKLRSIDKAVMHRHSVEFLKRSVVGSSTTKNVVISHHAPSPRSLPARYREDLLSAAYASDLESLINDLFPDLWIHGHIHSSCDYTVGKTRVVCNPRGYPAERNPEFGPDFTVEI